jgi:hypothetical protein
MGKNQHVVYRDGRWAVRGEGNSRISSYHVVSRSDGTWIVRESGEGRASKSFKNKSRAISFARSAARGSRGELIVHGRDGRIRDHDSYGQDSCPPRRKR